MRTLSLILALATLSLSALANPVAAKSTFDAIFEKLQDNNLGSSLTKVIAARTKQPRYFEQNCDATPIMDNPLYPGIPYKECTYKEGGLDGWVQLATIPAEMMSGWIVDACLKSPKARRCIARLAAYMWESNQFSFPIAGNIIETGNSAGASSNDYLNLVFLHGVTIPLPDGIPQRGSVSVAKQKAIIGALSRTTTLDRPAQVSRPSGIRREIYLRYSERMKLDNGEDIDVGTSCPSTSRKSGWLEVSRRSLVEAWNKPHHRLIAAAAQALEKAESPGRIPCN